MRISAGTLSEQPYLVPRLEFVFCIKAVIAETVLANMRSLGDAASSHQRILASAITHVWKGGKLHSINTMFPNLEQTSSGIYVSPLIFSLGTLHIRADPISLSFCSSVRSSALAYTSSI